MPRSRGNGSWQVAVTGFMGRSLAYSPPLPRFWVVVSLLVLLVFSAGLGPLSSSGPQPAAQAAAGLPAPSPALSAAPAAPLPTVYAGGRIAFESGRTRNVPGGNPAEIYVMEADGSDQINLTQNPATDRFPAWSPDGNQIAFTLWKALDLRFPSMPGLLISTMAGFQALTFCQCSVVM